MDNKNKKPECEVTDPCKKTEPSTEENNSPKPLSTIGLYQVIGYSGIHVPKWDNPKEYEELISEKNQFWLTKQIKRKK